MKVSIKQVHALLKQDPAKPDHPKVVKVGRRPLLSAQHLAYLTSPMILQNWAWRTLAERVDLFHRRFGEAKISTQTLFQVYKKHPIKRKALSFVKTMRYQVPEQRKLVIKAMIEQVRQAIRSGKRVIFSDEAVFTTETLPGRAYSVKKHSVHIE